MVSSPQPTASSIALVRCGSVTAAFMKNSTNSRYPAQAALLQVRLDGAGRAHVVERARPGLDGSDERRDAADGHHAEDPVGIPGGGLQAVERAHRRAGEHGPGHPDRVEHGHGVRDDLPVGVLRGGRPDGPSGRCRGRRR